MTYLAYAPKEIVWPPRRTWLDRIAHRLGYERFRPYERPKVLQPQDITSEAVMAQVEECRAKSTRVELMAMDTYGPDGKWLYMLLRFTAPKPGSYAEEQVTKREKAS